MLLDVGIHCVSEPFHQLNLLISFLTSVLNLTYIFYSVPSLRQNFLLQPSLQLYYLHYRSFFMNLYSFFWLNIYWHEVLLASQAQKTLNDSSYCQFNLRNEELLIGILFFIFYLHNIFSWLHVHFLIGKLTNTNTSRALLSSKNDCTLPEHSKPLFRK